MSEASEMELAAVKRLIVAVESMADSQEQVVRLLLEIAQAVRNAERG